MTTEFQASRTLVKSQPELWAECSDAGSLARHIGEFGEIRITRLEPETTVSWEAEHASGTVEIEPSGWGTRVTLTAQTKAAEDVGESTTPEPSEPLLDAAPAASEPSEQAAAEPPVAVAEPVPETAAPPISVTDTTEEETDAKVEEKAAESHPAVAASPAAARLRWKRLIARTRVWFGASGRAAPAPAHDPPPEHVAEPSPAQESEPELATAEPEPPEAVPADEATPPDEADSPPALDADAVLVAALDSLGQAHHRPFSRA